MHPAEEIRGVKSNKLKGKKVILGATGSIAAVETIRLARELLKHGAEVIPVMTKSATKIIHPDSLWFATGIKPIVELTGAAEHVSYCGRVKNPANLLLICPCTANTISKIAHGIDDTSVTTFATTAIGSNIPILIVPAMHLSMYDHKIIQKNIKICQNIGINFIEPNIEKNKAKLPDIEKILSYTIRQLTQKDFVNKKILIIGGPTVEEIDDIRLLTNKSSGKTAVTLAKQSFFMGANVTIWYGYANEKIPDYLNKEDFRTINDLEKLIEKTKLEEFDYIIVCAAIADYTPLKQKGKIKSGKKDLMIQLKPSNKIIPKIRKKSPNSVIVGFKVEDNKLYLNKKSKELLDKYKLDFVIGNTISGFSEYKNEIWIYDKKGKMSYKKDIKSNLAEFILYNIK